MIMKKSNINLMESYSVTEKRKSAKSDRTRVFILLLVGLILVTGAYAGKLFIENIFIKENIKTVSAYVNDIEIQRKVAIIDAKQKKIQDLNKIDAILTELNASFDVFPRINTLTLNMLTSNMPAGTGLKSITFDGQWFTILLYSPNYSSPSEYAIKLRNSEYFEEVIYQGYTSETSSGTLRYVGKIIAILKVGE